MNSLSQNPGSGLWWFLGAWLILVPQPSASAQKAVTVIPSVEADGSVLRVPSTWLPPDVDEKVPPVEVGAACPLEDVVQKAEKRILEFVLDVHRFTGAESLTHEFIGLPYDGFQCLADTHEMSFL